MQSLDRVRQTLAGKPVDHLAAQPMTMMFAARHAGMPFIDYTRDGLKLAEAQLKMVEDFGLEWFPDQGPAINEDRAALSDPARLKEFKVPDPLAKGRMVDRVKSIAFMRHQAGPDMSIVGWIEGPLALAQELRGLNTIMTDFFDEADFVTDLLNFCADVALRYAPAQIEAGADTMGMSDAAASLIGPQLYEKFVWPVQLRILRQLRERHPTVIRRLHMCGRTDPLISKMAELPVDIYELDFPVNLPVARAHLGPDRVICGNVSTITELLQGTPDEVYTACRRCHETCGRYHIVGAGCEVSPRTPPENLRAMLAYAREHQPDNWKN